ncbi:MAG: 7TM domain-containing protein [bacterium]|nr:7TM domain-containing protein [bacterium]
MLTAISYGILEWSWISTTLLSYPELLLAILLINIIIGRFSGLQLLELIRFMPLIKKHLDQEEEE